MALYYECDSIEPVFKSSSFKFMFLESFTAFTPVIVTPEEGTILSSDGSEVSLRDYIRIINQNDLSTTNHNI